MNTQKQLNGQEIFDIVLAHSRKMTEKSVNFRGVVNISQQMEINVSLEH